MRNFKALWSIPLVSLLVACGGGGGGGGDSSSDPAPVAHDPAPEGFYEGTSDLGAKLMGVVLDNGDYYVLHGQDSGGTYLLQGVVLGHGTAQGDRFTSSDARDFDFLDGQIYQGSLDATFTQKQNLTGTITESGGGENVGFSLAYDASYEQSPDLTADAGSYQGTALSPEGQGNAEVDVDTQGHFSGLDEFGCQFDGTMTPRDSGDVYDLSVSFQGSVCAYPGQTMQGIVVAEDGELIAVAPNAARTGGVFFIGQKALP